MLTEPDKYKPRGIEQFQSLTWEFSNAIGNVSSITDLVSEFMAIVQKSFPGAAGVVFMDKTLDHKMSSELLHIAKEAKIGNPGSIRQNSDACCNDLLCSTIASHIGETRKLLVHGFENDEGFGGMLWVAGEYLDQHAEVFFGSLCLIFECASRWLSPATGLDNQKNSHIVMDMIADSLEMSDIIACIEQVAATDSTVLILGESGTGKELIAKGIHQNSQRRYDQMIKVNCATLPANLIESELFGHEKGSFTGASDRRIGKFEAAHGGTLFLDEIGEMPLELQARLLRALQEREIERIGGNQVIKIDVRVVAATNRNLFKEVEEGRFRADLFYRLNIYPITIPPLRERIEDIRPLALHFLEYFSRKFNKPPVRLHPSAIIELEGYHWPGNVRELEHLIERTVLTNKYSIIKGKTLNDVLMSRKDNSPGDLIKTIDENERFHIMKVLELCRGRVGGSRGAAIKLGVPPTTLYSKMKKLGIKKGFRF